MDDRASIGNNQRRNANHSQASVSVRKGSQHSPTTKQGQQVAQHRLRRRRR